MNEYLKDLQICIDAKLQEYCMDKGKSIIDIHILYHHNISVVSRLFYNPQQHYSKIMVIAYNQVTNNGK